MCVNVFLLLKKGMSCFCVRIEVPLCSLILCVRSLLVSPVYKVLFQIPLCFSNILSLATRTSKFINDNRDKSNRNIVFELKKKKRGNNKRVGKNKYELGVRIMSFKYGSESLIVCIAEMAIVR